MEIEWGGGVDLVVSEHTMRMLRYCMLLSHLIVKIPDFSCFSVENKTLNSYQTIENQSFSTESKNEQIYIFP